MGMFDFFKGGSQDNLKDEMARLQEQVLKLQEQLDKANKENKKLDAELTAERKEKMRWQNKAEELVRNQESIESLSSNLRVETVKSAQSIVEAPTIIEEKHIQEFPKSADYVVKDWVNLDAVLNHLSDDKARIVDVSLKTDCGLNHIVFRLENGNEKIMKESDNSGFIPNEIVGFDGSAKDYFAEAVSDIRMAVVGKKLNELTYMDIIKVAFGEDAKVSVDNRDYREGKNKIYLSGCRHGEDVVLASFERLSDWYKRPDSIFSKARIASAINIFTLGDIEKIDCQKMLCSLDSCKEVFASVSRMVSIAIRNDYWHELEAAHSEKEKIQAKIKHNDKKKQFEERKPGDGCGYTGIWNATVKFSQERFGERMKNVYNDKELALFGQSVRFHCKTSGGVGILETPISSLCDWTRANDLRAATLIKCGFITREEGLVLGSYRPKIIIENREKIA